MDTYSWYAQLIKPAWSPPSWIFGPVWSVLYIIIAVSYGYAGYLFLKGRISFVVLLPFILNLVFNLSFTPIQFGLKNNLLAALDIILVLATIIWVMVTIFSISKWISYAQIPYLIWVVFATILQLTITYLNK